ncbi:hypothetical protein [Lactobacillus sp. B4005]|uniref:hypothetical protein n=1 Tax=Lactobacillus sp. B4005 TaxID=2818031 RepID=UPI00226A8F17|nr:hypothetical protein [Lactobacillus sp. B4005]MCX8723103.1 hypothetical protein [Lactobacillus sp. B4005]
MKNNLKFVLTYLGGIWNLPKYSSFSKEVIKISEFINFLSLLGDWLLFAFPLYQGLMELYDYDRFLEEFDQSSKSEAKISPYYWFAPIWKIHLEKKRAVKILREFVKDDEDFRTAMSFIDKTTAWYFVSLGGWFKMISSLYDFFNEVHLYSVWWLIVGTVLLTFTGLFSGYYRVSQKRQKAMLNKFKNEYNKKE